MTVDADEGAGAEGRDDMTVKHTAASEQVQPSVVCGLCMYAHDHKHTGMASLPIAMCVMHTALSTWTLRSSVLSTGRATARAWSRWGPT